VGLKLKKMERKIQNFGSGGRGEGTPNYGRAPHCDRVVDELPNYYRNSLGSLIKRS
jgi:hypothetical protein